MMAVAARHLDLTTYVAQCYRLERNYRAVKEIIDSGRIGDIRHIKMDYLTGYMHYWIKEMEFGIDKRWRLSEDSRGMLDGGVHAFDMVRFLTGQEAVKVYAQESAPLMAEYPHSSMVSAAFSLGNGITAMVSSTFGAVSPWRPSMALEIYGTKGTIRDGKLIYHDQQNGWKKQPDYSDFYAEKEILGWPSEMTGAGHPFGREIDHFIDCIEGKATSITPAWSGAHSALGVIKAMESIKKGVPVEIPDLRTRKY
ncbi:MAG: Gfo/Idh/MocA family oxidoreductase, partial [Lentisphaerota bacterium]